MNSEINNNSRVKTRKRGWLRDKIIPISILLLTIAITAGIFLYREKVAELGNYGYLGAFLIGLVSNASIILPVPGLLILFALSTVLNPILVGLIGAAGGALGELTGYMAGFSGRGVAQRSRMYIRLEGWMMKRGSLAIFAFALFPFLPLDVAGLVAGVSRFPIWKFLLACFLGKAVLYIIVLLTGAWGWEAILRWLDT